MNLEEVKVASTITNPEGRVTEVYPASGPFHGGNTVIITGKGMSNGRPGDITQVLLHGHPVQRIVTSTPSKLVVRAARLRASSDDPGTGSVTIVSRSLGALSLLRAYEYLPPPRVSRITEASGPHGGGNTVVIRGGHLCRKTASGMDTHIRLAGVEAKVTKCMPHAVYAVAGPLDNSSPHGRKGSLRIQSKAFGRISLPEAYEYLAAPQVTNVIPRKGPGQGGNRIKISGSGLTAGDSSIGEHVQVLLGDQPAKVVRFTPSWLLIEVPPSSNKGCVHASIISKRRGVSQSQQLYCYFPRPKITALKPSSGRMQGGTRLRIQGDGLHQGDVEEVWIGDQRAEVLSASPNGNTILVETPPFHDEDAEDGPLTVTVKSTTRGKARTGHRSAVEGFVVIPRGHITGVSPNAGPISGGTLLTIQGSNLAHSEEDVHSVDIGGTPARVISADPGSIVVETGPRAYDSARSESVSVNSKLYGTVRSPRLLAMQFQYSPVLHLTSVYPTVGKYVGGHVLEIRGSHLCDDECADLEEVQIGEARIRHFKLATPHRVVLLVPDGATIGGPGQKMVSLTSVHHGTARLPAAYTVEPVDAMASLSPPDGPMRGGYEVTLTLTAAPAHPDASYRAFLAGVPAQVLSISPTKLVLRAGDARSKAKFGVWGDIQPVEGEAVLQEVGEYGDGTLVMKRLLAVPFRYNPGCQIDKVELHSSSADATPSLWIRGKNLGYADETLLIDNVPASVQSRDIVQRSVRRLEVIPQGMVKLPHKVVLHSHRVGSCSWDAPASAPIRNKATNNNGAQNKGLQKEGVVLGLSQTPSRQSKTALPKTSPPTPSAHNVRHRWVNHKWVADPEPAPQIEELVEPMMAQAEDNSGKIHYRWVNHKWVADKEPALESIVPSQHPPQTQEAVKSRYEQFHSQAKIAGLQQARWQLVNPPAVKHLARMTKLLQDGVVDLREATTQQQLEDKDSAEQGHLTKDQSDVVMAEAPEAQEVQAGLEMPAVSRSLQEPVGGEAPSEEILQVDAEAAPSSKMLPAAPAALDSVTALPSGFETALMQERTRFLAGQDCHELVQLPAKYVGMTHIRGTELSPGSPVEFVVMHDATVYAAVDSKCKTDPIISEGFQPTSDFVQLGGCHDAMQMQVFAAKFPLGLVTVKSTKGCISTLWVGNR